MQGFINIRFEEYISFFKDIRKFQRIIIIIYLFVYKHPFTTNKVIPRVLYMNKKLNYIKYKINLY